MSDTWLDPKHAARGPGSHVVVNLTSREAVALNNLLPEVPDSWAEAVNAIAKVRAAASRACTPWAERTHDPHVIGTGRGPGWGQATTSGWIPGPPEGPGGTTLSEPERDESKPPTTVGEECNPDAVRDGEAPGSLSGGTSAGSARPPDPDELLTDLRLMGETPTHYGQEEHGEVHLEALARVAQLEEALRELQDAGVVVWHQASVGSGQVDIGPLDELADALAAARAVLAGGTPPLGEQTDAGDARGVAAEDTGLSGGFE